MQTKTEEIHSIKETIKTSVERILNTDSDYGELKESVENLRKIFKDFSGMDYNFLGKEEDFIKLPTGVAISPENAAACLSDFLRSVKFIRGVNSAINYSIEKFKNEKVHLLYAGTGPLGTLVIPQLHLFNPEKLMITYLDINEKSLAELRKIIEGLNLSSYTNSIICNDASTYKHPKDDPIHIVLSETMQIGLKKETQVAITLNMVQQLHEEGILIPENIEIGVEGIPIKTRLDEEEKPNKKIPEISLGKIFELNKYTAKEIPLKYSSHGNLGEVRIPAEKIIIPEEIIYPLKLNISTRIKVYNDIYINERESSLTGKYTINSKAPFYGGNILEFSYKIDKNPQFVYRLKKRKNFWRNILKLKNSLKNKGIIK